MSNLTIGFVGAGNMASAIIGGLINNGSAPEQILASDPYEPSLRALSERFRITPVADNAALVAQADVLVLAVKPQVMESVVAEFSSPLQARPTPPLLISIAAGINLGNLETWLDCQAPIVRCMPNTPALVSLGATGLFANEFCQDFHRQQAEQILCAIGICAWVAQEGDIDLVTAVSGSGPAYIFAVIEAMRDFAVARGMSGENANQFVLQTALGAATMAMESDVDVATLRERVTSPGGTTQAALEAFAEGGLNELFAAAMTAAQLRAQEMAGG